jgi:dihydrofolate reductase
MGRIVVSEFVTVDGVMEDPGGSEGSERGGWAFQFNRGPAGDKFKLDELVEAETLLLGRITYQGFAAAWPSRTGEFADKMNGMTKVVVSKTLTNPTWDNTRVVAQNIPDELSQLRSASAGSVLVAGSRQLVQTLMQNGLVDEYRLMVFPVVLGKGKRLFDEGLDKAALQLAESQAVGDDGVLTLIYHPAKNPEQK